MGSYLVVMDTSVPVRSPHGDPVAGSVPTTEDVVPGARHPGRRKRGDTGRGLCRRRVQVLAHPLPGQCLRDTSERGHGIHVKGESAEVALEQCPGLLVPMQSEGDAVDRGVPSGPSCTPGWSCWA